MADIVEWNDVSEPHAFQIEFFKFASTCNQCLEYYIVLLSTYQSDRGPVCSVQLGICVPCILKAKTDSDELAKRISNMEVKMPSVSET
ncbi:hypothetical protein GW17_00023809 [Ensete ventricosum]|nr:hypothetical protein GW17_00023809 [Ensete ventricosum]